MQIIPVIDLMGGIVVHAQGNDRSRYPPLCSQITQSIDPIEVVRDLLAVNSFSTIYIADLDAIFNKLPNTTTYTQLVSSFPDITFWLDAGITNQADWLQLATMDITPIIGSETLTDSSILKVYPQAVLSLDFQFGQFLGNKSILQQSQLWPDNIIAMNLDYVGAQRGPDVELLNRLQKMRSDVKLIAAGGVRNGDDIKLLQQQGIAGVLVASALHNGRLSF